MTDEERLLLQQALEADLIAQVHSGLSACLSFKFTPEEELAMEREAEAILAVLRAERAYGGTTSLADIVCGPKRAR